MKLPKPRVRRGASPKVRLTRPHAPRKGTYTRPQGAFLRYVERLP